MEHRGYIAQIEFDEEAGVFSGRVINTAKDGIAFQGSSVDELQEAFIEAVDDYIEWCESSGEMPEKPYSGKFVVRLPTQLHAAVARAAATRGVSINDVVIAALTKETTNQTPSHSSQVNMDRTLCELLPSIQKLSEQVQAISLLNTLRFPTNESSAFFEIGGNVWRGSNALTTLNASGYKPSQLSLRVKNLSGVSQ